MPGILCEHCTAVCCKYIALPLDKPETRSDFDDIRWYLLHAGVSVFVESGDWYILFQTTCRQLLPDNRCGIYETRPSICRKYSTENCDYHSGDYGWEHHFACPEHLDAYVRDHPPERNGRRGRAAGRRKRGANGRGSRRPRLRMRAEVPPRSDLRGVPLPVLPVG